MKMIHCKKFLFILLLVAAPPFFGCVSGPPKSQEIVKPEKYRVLFCKNIRKEEKSAYPIDIGDRFIKGKGEKVYNFIKWFDLIPRANYAFRYEYYEPDGHLAWAGIHRFTPKKPIWNTWSSLSLDPKHQRPDGLWSVKVYMNDSYIVEKQFLLADDEAELEELALKVEVQDYSGRDYDQRLVGEDTYYEGHQGQRWGVVIGISRYQDSRIPALRYASSDAYSFYSWLVSANGGRYAPSRAKLLLDRDATGRNIRRALFQWLGQALEEDAVTIYFAGHGSPQSPEHPDNLFLLPYDAQYDSIPTTGFPMWDVENALKRFIKAKKVVVIADACHAGGVGQAFDIVRRAHRGIEVNPISSGLQNLSKIGDGVCVITASDDKQFSQESKDWGGGHGVFTYFLLNGLKGEADYNKDQSVTLGELIPYLSEQVRRATRNTQSPTVAGKFDPALTIAK